MLYSQTELVASKLHDKQTFYQAFVKDLEKCSKEVIIENPSITRERMKGFRPVFNKMLKREVKIYVFTRDPKEHEPTIAIQAEKEIQNFESAGIQTFICSGNFQRKLAIIDREIIREGSINILSQANSREIMRRIEGNTMAKQMLDFLKLEKFIGPKFLV